MPRALTWSMSRASTLERCERRYFFEYVAGARRNSGDPRLRAIAQLKRLKSLALWQGDIFHTVAAQFVQALRFGRRLPPEHLAATAAGMLKARWRASSLDLGDGIVLFEHAYGVSLAPDALELAVERVGGWLRRFATWAGEHSLQAILGRARRVWIEPPAYGRGAPGFLLDDVQVLTRVDLAVERSDGTFVIYDWKTTAQPPTSSVEFTDDAELQVTAYQLWPHQTLGVPLEAITAELIYVAVEPLLVRTFAIDSDIRERAMRRVAAGIRRARGLHGIGDHAPLGEMDFDLAAAPWTCRWCQYKRICQDDLDDEGRTGGVAQEELGI